ncbi:hypothetical protein [Desulfobotulus alkaliphilus]|nr:hypothetical protein [Desulfobotulus alkaliphilus]
MDDTPSKGLCKALCYMILMDVKVEGARGETCVFFSIKRLSPVP